MKTRLLFLVLLFLTYGTLILGNELAQIKAISNTVQAMVPELKERSVGIRVTIGNRVGFGSGAIISADGLVLTCAHVVETAQKLEVIFANGSTFIAKKLGMNSMNDYALLKIPAENLPFFKIGNSKDLELLQWVVALGHPGGAYPDQQPAVSIGRIRGLHKRIPIEFGEKFYDDAIQTDVPIFAGNSGGPLVNLKGELIGINGAIMLLNDLAFAIPIDEIKPDLEKMKRKGKIESRSPGSIFEFFKILMDLQEDIPPEDMEKLFNDTPLGKVLKTLGGNMPKVPKTVPTIGAIFKEQQGKIKISQIQDNSIAALAGLKVGDIVVQVQDQAPKSVQEIHRMFQSVKLGQKVPFLVLRNEVSLKITVIFDKLSYARTNILKNAFADLGQRLQRFTVGIGNEEEILGCGVVIAEDGFILTAQHILPKLEKVWVYEGRKDKKYLATVVGKHEIYNLALLKIVPDKKLTPISLGKDTDIQIGSWVISVGTDNAALQVGMVSALSRHVPNFRRIPALGLFGLLGKPNKGPVRAYVQVIQHDSEMDAKQFGSPLVNEAGDLVGINVGHFYRGTTFATPISLIQQALPQLLEGKIIEGGPEYQPSEPDVDSLSKFLDYFLDPNPQKENPEDVLRDFVAKENEGFLGVYLEDHPKGAKVIEVIEHSAAANAGLKANDIINKFNGADVESTYYLVKKLRNLKPGTKIQLKTLRYDGVKYQELEISATLGARPK